MRHKRIELHITTCASWILKPFLLAGNKERWENSGLHNCLAINLLYADIREIADLQGINQVTEINVVSSLLQLFFQFVESERTPAILFKKMPLRRVLAIFRSASSTSSSLWLG